MDILTSDDFSNKGYNQSSLHSVNSDNECKLIDFGNLIKMSYCNGILDISFNKQDAPHLLSIDYSNRHPTKVEENDNKVITGEVFDSTVTIDSNNTEYRCCVFLDTIKPSNNANISFYHCFFLKGIELVGCRLNSLEFTGCLFNNYLIIENGDLNHLIIDRCNLDALWIMGTRIKQSTVISNLHMSNDLIISDCHITGTQLLLLNILSDHSLKIRHSEVLCETRLFTLAFNKILIHDCHINSFIVGDIICSHTLSWDGSLSNDYPEYLNDNSEEAKTQECIYSMYMFNNTIDGHCIISSNHCPTLSITKCYFLNNCSFTYEDHSFPLDEEYRLFNRLDIKYQYDVMIFRNNIFSQHFILPNVYKKIDFNDNILNGPIKIDKEYLSIVSGKLYKKINGNKKIGNLNEETLQTLNSCMNRYGNKDTEYYTIAKYVYQKENSSFFKKVRLTIHEYLSLYGTSPSRILTISALIFLSFSLLYYLLSIGSIIDCFYFSGITFFTIGFTEVGNSNDVTKILSVIEGCIGFLLMTYLVVVLCNKKY